MVALRTDTDRSVVDRSQCCGHNPAVSDTASYLTVEEAQRIVLEQVRPGRRVTLPLAEALGRTLAEPVRTDIDYPPFDRSMMDGFAVRAQDAQRAPVVLKVVGDIAAGAVASRSV